jgi:hypothetical protein
MGEGNGFILRWVAAILEERSCTSRQPHLGKLGCFWGDQNQAQTHHSAKPRPFLEKVLCATICPGTPPVGLFVVLSVNNFTCATCLLPTMASKTTRTDFEKVFPDLVQDLLGEAQKYNLPENALKWFEKVRAPQT